MKEPSFNEEQRRIIARRIRTNRRALLLTQDEVADKSGLDAKVIKKIERARPVSALSYKTIAEAVGISQNQLLRFESIEADLKDLIEDLVETNFSAPRYTRDLGERFASTNPEAFYTLYKSGLIPETNDFNVFDLLVTYKGRLDFEFATYLKDVGIQTEQRLQIHAFAVFYYLFSAVPRERRVSLQIELEGLMQQVVEFVSWKEEQDNPTHEIDPVTGEIRHR